MYPFTTLGTPESILWAFLLALIVGPIIAFPPRRLENRRLIWSGLTPGLLMVVLLIAYYQTTVIQPLETGREPAIDRQFAIIASLAGLPALAIGMVIAYIRRLIASRRN